MNWKLVKLFCHKRTYCFYNYSEEVRDIIERMPTSFGKGIAMLVVGLAFVFFLFGWLIKYPDTIPGKISINSNNAPVKLVANVSGKLQMINFQPQDSVDEGDYIAIIQNPAKMQDVRLVKKIVENFNPNRTTFIDTNYCFPSQVALGELTVKYYSFLNSYQSVYDYERINIDEQRIKTLNENIAWKSKIQEENRLILSTVQERLNITSKWSEKYKQLNQKEIIHDYDYDKIRNEFIAVRQEIENLNKEILINEMQLNEYKNTLLQIKIEKEEKEKQIRMSLLLAHQDLLDNIKGWEQKYAFIAPLCGKVEFLKFMTENQYVQLGEEVFTIIPRENIIYGQMYLPAGGAGKVKEGDKVVIKLDNFPYMEFGAIEGKINSISLVSQPRKLDQANINTYLVSVDLPFGLTTNYGKSLNFKYEIEGQADIVVNERRLIQRLFDNLKYIIK